MDALSVSRCDPQQFKKVYQDLLQLGTLNHERLVLRREGQHSLPATSKKGVLDFFSLDEKSRRKVLEFLEIHMDQLIEQEQAHHLFLKLETLFEGDEKIRFNQIHQLFFKSMAAQQMEKDRLAKMQQEEQQLHEIEIQRLHELEKRVQEKETELLSTIQLRAKASEAQLQQTEDTLHTLENKLAVLKKENAAQADTLLVCKDGQLQFYMKLLEKVCLFKMHKQHQAQEMKRTNLTAEEAQRFAYKFDFKDFEVRILDLFSQWLWSPDVLTRVTRFEDLCELYRLADYLNDISLQSDCLTHVLKYLNDDYAMDILSSCEFTIEDGLVKACCERVAKNFKQLTSHAKFAEIQAEYFQHILKSDYLHVDHEEKVWQALISWSEAQAKRRHVALRDVLMEEIQGERILHAIRFENLDKEHFMTHVLPLKVLSLEEVNDKLARYLCNDPSARPRFYALQCKDKGNDCAKVSWNMPISDFYAMGDWNENTIIRQKFSFKECLWELQMGREGEDVIIAILAHDPAAHFEFFLDIHKIHYYTKPPKQNVEQKFENNGRGESSYIRGVCFKSKILEDNIEASKHCLPIKIKIYTNLNKGCDG